MTTPGGGGGALPGAPTNLVANAPSSSQVNLSWTDNTTVNVVFLVERAVAGGTFSEIATTAVNATSFTDASVSPSTSYAYRVRARSVDTSQSTDYSNQASTTTSGGGFAPSPPSALQAFGVTATSCQLRWIDASGNEEGFAAQFFDGASWQTFSNLLPDTTSMGVTNLAPGATYRFRIVAFNSFGSSPSNEVSVTTQGDAGPSPPTGFGASRIKKKKVDLRWTDTSDNEDNFEVLVFRNGEWQTLGVVGANATAARVVRLSRLTTYRFGVRACNSSGCSSITEATVTTR